MNRLMEKVAYIRRADDLMFELRFWISGTISGLQMYIMFGFMWLMTIALFALPTFCWIPAAQEFAAMRNSYGLESSGWVLIFFRIVQTLGIIGTIGVPLWFVIEMIRDWRPKKH